MSPLLSVDRLSIGYGSDAIIDNITLEIYGCEFIGIVGPNGSGKTTFIKTLSGQLPPLSGTIRHHISDLRFGYLPQISTHDSHFPITVRDVVLSGLNSFKSLTSSYTRSDGRHADQIMDRVGILSHRDTRIGDLSGGELRRVLLGRALIVSPDILILDEPATYLDNRFEQELYALLSSTLSDSTTVLMISHDPISILGHSSRIVSIDHHSFQVHSSEYYRNKQEAAAGFTPDNLFEKQ